MQFWFAATIAYAVVITCLFVIVYSSADENSMLYNKRIENLLAEIKFQNEIIDNLQKNDDALYDEHRHNVLSLEEKNRDLQRKVLSLEDMNMDLRLALIEMKDVK